MGTVTGNRCWASCKHRIRDFATKYGRQLKLDRTKEAKSIEDRLSQAVARRDLERKTSERYKGFVVRSRLKRNPNKAVKSNTTAREEEVRMFPDRYIDSVKSPDRRVLRSNREIRDAFRAHFPQCWYANRTRKPKSKMRQAQSDDTVNRNLRKYVTVDIFNSSIKFQLDSGSDISIISWRTWRKLNKPTLLKTDKTAKSVTGQIVNILREVILTVTTNRSYQKNWKPTN